MNQEPKEPNMKNNEQKERDIRAYMERDLDYQTAIISVIASCMSSNVGGKEERLLEINIVLRMIETIRLTDLAKYVATHIEGVDGDTVFDMWWRKAYSDKEVREIAEEAFYEACRWLSEKIREEIREKGI